MTGLAWAEVRELAVGRFGSEPGLAVEERVLAVFMTRPQAVVAAVEKVAGRYEAGLVRSPWPVLALEVEQQKAPAPVAADPGAEHGRAVARAEQWVRACGLHFDRWAEVEEELFDPHLGRLRAFAGDRELQARLQALWEEVRPVGVQVELEAEERARAWKARRQQAPVAVLASMNGQPSTNGDGFLR